MANPDICVISNVPREITDIYYNSVEDFKKVVDYMYRFYAETNSDTKKYDKHRKDIVLVMDEAQIYFPAR
jgi:DNA helicase HerA-like ATPase